LSWKRLGRCPTLAIAFIVANGVFYATHHHGFSNFLFLFCEGMLGCELVGKRLGWAFIASLTAYAASPVTFFSDALLGITVALGMAYLATNPKHPVASALSLRPLVYIGTFSYSIYLVHAYFQHFGYAQISRWHLSAGAQAFLMIFALTPVIIAGSYLFHLAVERPFMSRKRQPVEARVEISV
jgi:peptidoglycan/LPS O-acetylase OafA/YrhL